MGLGPIQICSIAEAGMDSAAAWVDVIVRMNPVRLLTALEALRSELSVIGACGVPQGYAQGPLYLKSCSALSVRGSPQRGEGAH